MIVLYMVPDDRPEPTDPVAIVKTDLDAYIVRGEVLCCHFSTGTAKEWVLSSMAQSPELKNCSSASRCATEWA